jgi:hypothetical protein
LSKISSDPKSFNTQFLTQHSKSSQHILGAAEGLVVLSSPLSTGKLGDDERKAVISILEKMAAEDVPPSIAQMLDALELVRVIGGTTEEVRELKGKCKGRVPLAGVFEESTLKVNGNAVEGEGEKPNGVKADV